MGSRALNLAKDSGWLLMVTAEMLISLRKM